MERYDTNIQHEGECPDCTAYEKKIDRLYAKESEMQSQLSSALESYNRECKRNDELQEQVDNLIKLQSETLRDFNIADQNLQEANSIIYGLRIDKDKAFALLEDIAYKRVPESDLFVRIDKVLNLPF